MTDIETMPVEANLNDEAVSAQYLDAVQAAHAARNFSGVVKLCSLSKSDSFGQYDLYKASALYELGRFEDAIVALDSYAFASGDDCHAPMERLKLLYLAGRWSEVVASGNRILEDAIWFISGNDTPKVQLLVAVATAESGDLLGAWRVLKEIVPLEPNQCMIVADIKRAITAKMAGLDAIVLRELFRPELRLLPAL